MAYIKRETLLKAVEKMDRLDKETNTQYEYDKEGYILLIQNAPTADVVEVKHGYWDCNYYDDEEYEYECSMCGGTVYKKPIFGKPSYCEHCGAKMDGQRKNDFKE